MELDPHIAGMLAHLRGLGVPDMADLPVAVMRDVMQQNCRQMEGPPPDAQLSVQDVPLTGATGPLAGRLYRLADTETVPGPAILFIHGGGFVAGDLDSHDMVCRRLAVMSGLTVLAATYRLGPEHPLPAAHDDALSVLAQIGREGAAWGIDPTRLVLAGDSAGANLVLATTLDVPDGTPCPRGVLMFYPVTELKGGYPSRELMGRDYLLTERTIQHFNELSAPDLGTRADPRINLVRRSHFGSCPPVLLLTAGFDPLCDEGVALVERLRAENIAVEHRHCPGLIHAFIHMTGVTPAVMPILADAAAWCRAVAAGP